MNSVEERPREAARRLSCNMIEKGYKPEALHEYQTTEGEPLYYRIRLKNPDTGEKWIRPFKFLDGKGFVMGEPDFPNGKPLYGLNHLTEQPKDTVFICEGEWCVDKLTALGILSVTSGSADSANAADWLPLAGRKVIIWPDNDDAGYRFTKAIVVQLRKLGCELWQVDVGALDLPHKGDAVDWLSMNSKATYKDVSELPLIDLSALSETEGHEEKKTSQASSIVAFVRERAELFHDRNSEVYAFDSSTHETRRLDGRQFKDWLRSALYEATDKAPSDQSIREALATLSGLARFKGECYKVYIRVAEAGGAYYLDLAESGQSRVICVTAGTWRIIEEPPIKFLRPETIRPLPEPITGGDLAVLWGLVNIPEDDRLLIITWLLDCLRPETPFPVLELVGEQGSAKSTTQTILRRLIDPNSCNLRAAPKSREDVFVSGGGNWLVSYENISYLSPQMQDAFCVLATGGGFAKRKLYSDSDESVIDVKRPIVLNGISVAVTAQDLVDRTISIETPVITKRTENHDILTRFEESSPYLLGALLDIFAQSLSCLPSIQLPSANSPRLIEFARLGMAVAKTLNYADDRFMEVFNDSRNDSIARTIDASPVASALIEWFDKRNKEAVELPLKMLLAEVESYRPQGSDGWPKSPKAFGDGLRRVAPALRQMGIECRSLGKIGGNILWEIKVVD